MFTQDIYLSPSERLLISQRQSKKIGLRSYGAEKEKDEILFPLLLSSMKRYEATYDGRLTPETIHGCELVAGRFNDTFDIDKRSFSKLKLLENNYLDVISQEQKNNRTLIAFDSDWVLAGVKKYIENEESFGIQRTEALREKIAKETTKLWPEDSNIMGWDLDPSLFSFYIFQDNMFRSTNGCVSKLFMIFAPVNADEAENINLYLYRDVRLFSFDSYLVKHDMTSFELFDLRYLFPINAEYLNNYLIISSDQLFRDQLEEIVDLGGLSIKFPRLNDLMGVYASYLLAEATYYQFDIRWSDNVLFLGSCGYIQMKELQEFFLRILNDMFSEGTEIHETNNYATASAISKKNKTKAFYYQGKYYVVGPYTSQKAHDKVPDFVKKVELEGVFSDSPKAALYRKGLGYENNTLSSIPDNFNIKIGHMTYELTSGGIFTLYYYKSSSGAKIDIHEISGTNIPEIKEQLQNALSKGFFFTRKMKNILKNYPDFIPSYPIRSIILSKDIKEMEKQLNAKN